MGLFAQQPEEPTEWTGLPSEPLRPLGEAELLRDPPDVDLLFGGAPASTAWVEIPVEPLAEGPASEDATGSDA